MEWNDEDSSFNVYSCPVCEEDYTIYEDMIDCWKGHIENLKAEKQWIESMKKK